MGRAQGHTSSAAGFDAVVGARRGSGRLNLAAATPDSAAVTYAEELRRRALDGDLDPALTELRRSEYRHRQGPLLDQLRDALLRGADMAGKLHQPQRESLQEQLGLSGRPPMAEASPVRARDAAERRLQQILDSDEERSGQELVQAARDAHLRAYAVGLAKEASLSPGILLRDVFGDELPQFLAQIPGNWPLEDSLRAAHDVGGLLPEVAYQSIFKDVLIDHESGRREALRTQLDSSLYSAAFELAENDSR